MSLPRADYDPRRVCLNPFPALNGVYESIFGGKHRRSIGIYVSGAIFAIAQWLFLDACILSSRRSHRGDVPVQVEFIDWLPGIFSFLGYIIVNLIDKDRVRGEEGGGDSRAVWRARLFLFVGFAMMAGGLAGSVCVLVLRYILGSYPDDYVYYGYANVGQNAGTMISAMVLWMAQSVSSEYEYNLTL